MTTLLQRCHAVDTKIQQLQLAHRHANQQRLVQERTREWKSRNDKLKVVDSRAACLPLNAAARAPVDEKRGNLRHNAAQVLERLTSNEDLAQLTSDASWTRLLASVEGLTEELENAGKLAWKTYVEGQGALEDPSWLRDRAPSTPMNDAAIAAYRTHYGVYASLAKLAMPRNADDLSELSSAIAAGRAEVAKIAFDVLPEVQRFFQDVQSGSATLASLTPGVLQWLTEHAQLNRYKVRSAGQ